MDKKSYAFGMSVASSFYQQGIHVANVDDFLKGLKDMLTGGKLELTMDEAGAAAKAEGEKFLAQMAKDPQVKATGSGLMYKVIKEGTGKKPKATDKVYCHYEGSFPDGKVFDSSYKRGEPIEFGLNQVIKGWTEGLQLMSEGAKYELYLPYHLAYGESGTHGIPPCSALKFVVELIEVR